MVKKSYSFLSWLVVVMLVALAILLVGVRFIGYSPYVVLSGSMEPIYPVGSMVYIQDVDTTDIEVGDSITYVFDESTTIVTHQVIEVAEDSSYFYTKGVANDIADGSPVLAENVLGRVVFCIPLLGYISEAITTPPVLYIFIGSIIAWMIITYMIDTAYKDKHDKVDNNY